MNVDALFKRRKREREENEEEVLKRRKRKAMQEKYKDLFDINPKAHQKYIENLLERKYIYEKEIKLMKDLRRKKQEDEEVLSRNVLSEYKKLVAQQRRAKKRRAEEAVITESTQYMDLSAEIEGNAGLLRRRHHQFDTYAKNHLAIQLVELNQVQKAALRQC